MTIQQAIDRVDGQLEPLNTFVINGGCLSAAQAHVCRTVCRRAERLMVTLSSTVFIDPVLMRYVNRLSDFLFVFARYQNKQTDTPEIFWQKS